MGKVLVKKHNFDIAKRKIKNFSQNMPSNPSFDRFKDDTELFGLIDRKVTGKEMNAFSDKVQNKLISVNP